MNLITNLKEEILIRCNSQNNSFGPTVYHHIESVALNAVELAKLYGADTEICEIAGWLHDIASITSSDLYKEHHIHGAKIARELLKSYNYPEDKIKLVEGCILNHRGSILNKKTTIEEICVADADAISHFDTLPSLFYLAFSQKKLSFEDGITFIRDKLNRSYNKMSLQSQKHYLNKKVLIESILTQRSLDYGKY